MIDDSETVRKGASRRHVLQALTAFAGAPLVAGLPAVALAEGTAQSDFMAVSTALVGRHEMTAEYGDALVAAFTRNDPAFGDKVSALLALIGSDPIDGDTLTSRLAGADKDVAALPQAILTGWYLGIAGSGKDAICVAYASNFANRTVADVLRPPSYAYGAYGSWSSRPA